MTIKKSAPTKFPVTAFVEEGPYYKTGSPERQVIADENVPGIILTVEGQVNDTAGKPIAHAWLDFWQADGTGQYDNEGYVLRGHQYSDKKGRYHLETVKPLGYQSRSPHVHVKVRAADKSPILTTQLFFPAEKKNKTDFIFNQLSVMDVQRTKDGDKAVFNFVVET